MCVPLLESVSMLDRHTAVTRSYLIPGWMWPSELCWLYDTISKSNTHAEIGSFCGRSTFASCVGMKAGSHLLAVEPFILGELADIPSEQWVKDTLASTFKVISEHGIHITHQKKTSLELTQTKPEGKFDSVFIDGSHHYADVACDIECWMPLIRQGGIISGHDYWPRNPGVMDAVNELIPNFRVAPDTRIWWAIL